MEKLFIAIVYFIIIFLISHFIGRKKKVGFWWSFFFCSFLTPIIGLIITLMSYKKEYVDANKSKGTIIGGLLVVLGVMSLLGQLQYLYIGPFSISSFDALWFSIGITGWGIYLSKESKEIPL